MPITIPLSGYAQNHQQRQVQIKENMPKTKADIVKNYSKLINKKKSLQSQGEPVPNDLLETLAVYDSVIYKTFTPQERKLVQQQAVMDR